MTLPDGLWGAVEYQESRNRPGVLGQPTQYGTPQGDSQMLPATAQEMAGKLGLPWQPDLMTGTSPQAANYQSTLGQTYLQQGYDATGNPRDALRYYYGGPNPSMWGPKTNAYADQVLSRWNNQQPTGDPPQGPYYSSGGQSPMPLSMPSLPPARPLTSPNQGQNAPLSSLGALANAGMSTDLPTAAEAFAPQGGSTNPASLAALANPATVKGPSKFNLGNVLGVMGDAFSAYGGRQPTFGPFLQQQAILQQQQDFERQKFGAELAMQLYRMRNPEWLINSEVYDRLPYADKQKYANYETVANPATADVQQPNGAMVRQIFPRQAIPSVGEVVNGRAYLGGPLDSPQSWGPRQ